jgi:hypothetical protein
MSSLRSKAKTSAQVRSWRRVTDPQLVEATDAKAAELAAVRAFNLDEWQCKRLLVRE